MISSYGGGVSSRGGSSGGGFLRVVFIVNSDCLDDSPNSEFSKYNSGNHGGGSQMG